VPRDEAFVAEIRALGETISEKNHYEVLGIEPDVAPSVIQAAFFRLARRWHPDRLGSEFADVKDLAMRVFARMTEAHQVLSNEGERREYDRALRGSEGSAEHEEVQRVLRAVTAFQKAEVLSKRGNLVEAEKQAELAVQNDPEQAEYFALYADILSQNPERQKTNKYADVVKMVNEARKRQQDNMKVRLYRARVLNRSGDADAAYREFRNIVEQDANNVEAAREVRLYEMRRGKKTTDPRKSVSPGDPRRSQPRANDKAAKPDNKGALNQDIGQIFGKLFKR
jgi:curved DNA-binding protein CbpA